MIKPLPMLDSTLDTPLYEQLASYYELLILQGILKSGTFLPTEADHCEALQVSIKVVKSAFAILKERNLIQSIRGKGVFVSYSERTHVGIHDLPLLGLEGYPLTAELLVINEVDYQFKIQTSGENLQPSKAYMIREILRTESTPVAIKTTYVPALGSLSESLGKLDKIRQHSLGCQFKHHYRASRVAAWEAQLLHCEQNALALHAVSNLTTAEEDILMSIETRYLNSLISMEFDTYAES